MQVFEGTHGTSQSRAKEIRNTGFRTSSGRYGVGAYFWRKGRYDEVLAESWWRFRASQGEYSRDREPNYELLRVKISVGDDEYINLEEHQWKEDLARLADKLGVPQQAKEMGSLYNKFIETVEQMLKMKIKVYEIRVPAPKDDYYSYPGRFLGWPLCYVVRDRACIQLV